MRNFFINARGELVELSADPVNDVPGQPFHVGDGKTWKLFYSNHQLFNKFPTKLTLLQYWVAVVIYLVEREIPHTK